ncbi:MAG: efflux RND transporter periplasmic adaptor subunit [Betaproteobacteria bacterium]|nr:efflux RND transporter periplasmic adaptor subunit [Betaproteobacteria bacterium]
MPGQTTPGQAAPPLRARRRRKRSPFVWIIAVLILAALAGGGWYAWKTWYATEATRERVVTATVQRGDLEDAVTATGTLQPRDFVDVGTQVSGQLKVLKVAIGDSVKAGDLLAEIDPTVFQSRVDANQAQLRNQQAQLADKQSQLALAELQQARQRGLMKENATTAEALQSAEASVRSITAQIDAIRAQMQQTESSLRGDEANLGYTKIFAPMSGTVAYVPTKQGQTLNANQQAPVVLRLADLSVMTVQAQVSEADVPKLKVGMEVYFTTLGGDTRRWYGTLRQINPTPSVVNNVVLYDALFDVPNTTGELMTQMTAQVFFISAAARDAVFVPITALRPAGGAGRRGGAGKGEAANVDGATTDGAKADIAKSEPAKASSGADSPVAGDGVSKAERRRGEGRFKGGEGKRGGAEAAVESAPAKKGGAEAKGPGARGGRPGDAGSSTDPRAQFANGRAMVRVAREDGSFEDREVKIGMMNRVSAQILEGLQAGEQVQIGAREPGGAGKGGAGKGAGGKGGGAPKFAAKI